MSSAARTALATLLLSAAMLSCSPGYVLRAAWEEAKILSRRRPIADILDDAEVDPRTRAKLELVVQARSFARRDLNLDVGASYTSFSDIGRDTLALVLSASPIDRLAAYTWWFPIVGRVPYKGFFSLESAREEQRKLEEKHYDTYLRPTSAFSTLGWLPDPLLSTVLRQDSVGLVETVIHEVTHNTLFISGHVKFNESFANFVGSVGAVEFFCGRRGAEEPCQIARDRWHDSRLLSRFLDRLWDDLEALYSEGLPYERLIDRRSALLSEADTLFQSEFAPLMRTGGFARFDATRMNNARLIARHLYYNRLPLFQRVYERTPGLTEAFDLIADAVRAADDPWSALEGLSETSDSPQR